MIWLLACGPPEPPPEIAIAEASGEVTWESTALLGPHHYTASVETTQFDRPSTQTVDVLWADWDNYEIERRRDGRLNSRVLLLDGQVWQGDDNRMRTSENVELYRRELATTWNVFEEALRPFADVVVLEKTSETVVEGRPALVYAVSMKADVPTQSKSVPTELSGTVTVDEGTAVRLLADVSGTVVDHKGNSKITRVILTRSEIGQVPELVAPTNTGRVRPESN